MKTTILKSVLFSALMAGAFTSCVNDDDYGIPEFDCTETSLVKTKEVADIPATATLAQYLGDDVIEAYVTSSDEGGNFFKTISFQTLDGSKGFSVPIDATSTFISFTPGRKVFVKMKNLYTDLSNGGKRIGAVFISSSGNASVGRLLESQYKEVLVASCQLVNEDDLVRTMTIAEAKNDANINTLIELDGVQFSDGAIASTYYDAANVVGGATNHLLNDINGNSVIFRTSSFATYAGRPVPDGSGKVRGVMTKFGSDYQFMARTERDVKLDQERFFVDFAAPIVGDAIVYSGSFTENFESYSTTVPASRVFPAYINDPLVGSRYWETKTFSNNKYIQMTSFGGTAEANRSLFIVPVDMTAANTFAFQSKSGFTNGLALKVYYILEANYTPGAVLNPANLVDITSSFTISPGQSNGYPNDFTNSGNYAIPASLTGNGFFVFEYTGNGSGGVTSTIQIDNITVN